jgi:acetoin utilization protein AcuC
MINTPTLPASPLLVAYDKRLLNWVLAKGHPTKPIRAKLAVDRLRSMKDLQLEVIPCRPGTHEELELVHDRRYLGEVLGQGECSEWVGRRQDLAETARLMFGGTMTLVDRLLEQPGVAFAPAGAKHHAHRDHASGFCVFADMAAAAIRFADQGLRVMYVDVDAHHGDGVEEILRSRRDITTCSVHDSTIFPGTGHTDDPRAGAWNWPLQAGAGDRDLLWAVEEILELQRVVEPDVMLLAWGADGHVKDPLSSLRYSFEGLQEAAARLAEKAPSRVLVGGSGGYEPYKVTPRVWSEAAATFARAATRRNILAGS